MLMFLSERVGDGQRNKMAQNRRAERRKGTGGISNRDASITHNSFKSQAFTMLLPPNAKIRTHTHIGFEV